MGIPNLPERRVPVLKIAEITEVSDACIENLLNLPKCGVPVLKNNEITGMSGTGIEK